MYIHTHIDATTGCKLYTKTHTYLMTSMPWSLHNAPTNGA